VVEPRASLPMNGPAATDDAQPEATEVGLARLAPWLTAHALRRWPGLLAVLATMLARTGLDVLKPWPMKVLVDHALGAVPVPAALALWLGALPGAQSREGLVAWSIAATVILFVLSWAVGVATAYANIAFGQRMVYDVASDLFGHLQRLSLRFHSRKSVGDSIRRVTTDTACVAVIVKDAVLPLVTSAISLVVMFGVMWRLEFRLTLVSLLVVPGMVLALRRSMAPMLERSYEEQEAEGRIYTVIERTLTAVPVVQAFGREAEADREFADTTRAVTDAALASAAVGLEFKIMVGTATALGTAAITWLGAAAVLDGRMTIGSLLVFLAYLGALYGPIESIMYTPSTTQGAAGSARRVLEILDTRREVDDRPGAPPLPPVRGHVRVDAVTFGYEPDRRVLDGVSFDASPGDIIALVGPSGAGKSTVVGLLPRFFDAWSGTVSIDGHDVRDVQLASLRAQVAIVLQEAFLFPLTIAENIAYARPHATRMEIEAAARVANAHAFIERLPDGYDTIVGERGATLSGGERQRISIARAVLKDAPILILDEPTSAMDAETEQLILDALDRLMKDRTTFIIAHRLSTVRKADRILVLEAGRIVESGIHDDLIARRGVYARYHALQFGPGTEDRTP
jgi:ATP-binding cassette subfamily B protein/subfamily B ATP-binding cassette protein MsbA